MREPTGWYTLRDKKPFPATAAEFNDLRQSNDWIVGKSETSNGNVSTIFLGLDHRIDEGAPLLFKTMVFGGSLDGDYARYDTWEAAEIGHAAMVDAVLEEIPNRDGSVG